LRPDWDFEYLPVPTAAPDDDGSPCDVVVAFRETVDVDEVRRTLGPHLDDARVALLLDRAPLHWVRVRSPTPMRRDRVLRALERYSPRYVASSTRPSTAVGRPALWSSAAYAGASTWKARAPRAPSHDPDTEGRWFLREGIALDRSLCGTGAGTRFAVIDEDLACAEHLDLDAVTFIDGAHAPGSNFHGTLMVGWAVETKSSADNPARSFQGVAPDASTRMYCVRKAGTDVTSVPLALVRAVDEGADVVLATTFVEGSSSPMLDDALEFATRLGRRGRGTPVVMAAGRHASSPEGSMHASWTLSFSDPAADPRVMCVGPSGRDGAWLLWRDRRGRFRPFANRGPSVRCLAPGDDIAYPFEAKERMFHAESSGAAAIAAGVLLLVLSSNPRLSRAELDALVVSTCEPALQRSSRTPIADAFDLMPITHDRDGHDPKQGYGRIHATRACIAARDPIAATLVNIGEDGAAVAWMHARRRDSNIRGLYTPRLARWIARALLTHTPSDLTLRAIVRHTRLVARARGRQAAHGEGALLHQIAIAVRELGSIATKPRPTSAIRSELRSIEAWAASASLSAELPAIDERMRLALASLWQCSDDGAPKLATVVGVAHGEA